MIGTTSTEEKAQKAKACGVDEVILYSTKDFVEEVNRITEGAGVNVIFDGVGKATFNKGKLYVVKFIIKYSVILTILVAKMHRNTTTINLNIYLRNHYLLNAHSLFGIVNKLFISLCFGCSAA